MPDHESLQPARLCMQARQAHELALDLLPVRQGIQEKALIAIDRHHELPLGTLGDLFSIPVGNDHPALVVQGYLCCTAKHGLERSIRPFPPTSSHFAPL